MVEAASKVAEPLHAPPPAPHLTVADTVRPDTVSGATGATTGESSIRIVTLSLLSPVDVSGVEVLTVAVFTTFPAWSAPFCVRLSRQSR